MSKVATVVPTKKSTVRTGSSKKVPMPISTDGMNCPSHAKNGTMAIPTAITGMTMNGVRSLSLMLHLTLRLYCSILFYSAETMPQSVLYCKL